MFFACDCLRGTKRSIHGRSTIIFRSYRLTCDVLFRRRISLAVFAISDCALMWRDTIFFVCTVLPIRFLVDTHADVAGLASYATSRRPRLGARGGRNATRMRALGPSLGIELGNVGCVTQRPRSVRPSVDTKERDVDYVFSFFSFPISVFSRGAAVAVAIQDRTNIRRTIYCELCYFNSIYV